MNIDVPTGSNTLTVDANSFRFNAAGAATVTLAGTGSLRDVAGGVLVTSNVGANLSLITGGIMQGSSRRDTIFIQNNTAGDLEVDSVLTDLAGQSNGITKSGAGRLILTASNSIGGTPVINEGTVVVTGGYTPVPTGTITGNIAAGSLSTGHRPEQHRGRSFVGEKGDEHHGIDHHGQHHLGGRGRGHREQHHHLVQPGGGGDHGRHFCILRRRRPGRHHLERLRGRGSHPADWKRGQHRLPFFHGGRH